MQLTSPALDIDIVTPDPERASAFYRNQLGLESIVAGAPVDGGVRHSLAAGRHRVNLLSVDASPEQDIGGTAVANGIRLLAFIFPDLDAIVARLDAAGHDHQRLPLPERAPFQVAFASDADGNALELVGLRDAPAGGFSTRMQVGLTVSDRTASRRFYGEVLGLEEEPVMKLPPSMQAVGNERYGFLFGGTTLKFWSHGPELPTRSGQPEARTGLRRIVARVADVDVVAEQLRRDGVRIEVEPRAVDARDIDRDSDGDVADGAADRAVRAARTMSVSDPDGNWIELRSA